MHSTLPQLLQAMKAAQVPVALLPVVVVAKVNGPFSVHEMDILQIVVTQLQQLGYHSQGGVSGGAVTPAPFRNVASPW